MRTLIVWLALSLVPAASSADILKYTDDNGVVCYTNASFDKKDRKVERVMRERLSSAGEAAPASSSLSSDFSSYVHRAASKYDLEPELIHAVIKTESNGNHRAVSRKGAMGLMQLMPSTASDMNVSNPFSPEQNIEGGSRYLRYLLEKFNGNLTLALAAYNAGPKRVEQYGTVPPIAETKEYVKKVYAHYRGKRSYEVDATGQPDEPAKPKPTPIYRVTLDDGTVLFTNASISDPGKKIRF